MWRIEKYDGSQDLTFFFQEAEKKRFFNNSSANMLLSTIEKDEDEAVLFLLYNNDRIIGTTVAHSLRELGILGEDAHRIAARICVLSHLVQGPRLHTSLRSIKQAPKPHDHPSAQFLIPACIEHCGRDKPMYISTNASSVGKQKAVHTKWAPEWQRRGYLEEPIELEYRGSFQSFWKFNVDNFYKEMEDERWKEAEEIIPILGKD
jgi:hypothetical protein